MTTNKVPLDRRVNLTSAEFINLVERLADMTAQRDQLRAALTLLDWAAVQLASRGFLGGEKREKAEARVVECSVVARAALLACSAPPAEGGGK